MTYEVRKYLDTMIFTKRFAAQGQTRQFTIEQARLGGARTG